MLVASVPIQFVTAWELWKILVWLGLIPISYGRHFGVQLFVETALFPAERLYRHLQIFFETDGVGDVPAVKAKLLAGLVDLVGRQHLRETRVGSGEGLVFVGLMVLEIV